MLILGIETSCDETACAIVKNGRTIVSNVVLSQIAVHKKYGGVVPELASRKHVENINFVIEEAFSRAKVSSDDLDAVAVTQGPGLVGSLLVGISSAKTIAGHLYANFLQHRDKDLYPPFIAIIISGGHTDLILMEDYGVYRILGRTRDDAAGEAYDKVAKLLDLGYPGGPVIDSLAIGGNPRAINFARPYLRGSWDFSFSGLKTAVVYYVAKHGKTNIPVRDIAASFQQCAIEVLVNKTIDAAREMKIKKIIVGGGVAANSALRKLFTQKARENKMRLWVPAPELCTDNAAMIACAGFYKIFRTDYSKSIDLSLNAVPRLEL